MMESEALKRLAPKLGITSARVLGKAEEFLRLSHVKCTGLSAVATATSNAVMCLQLAATSLNHPIDKDYLVRLSGLNKKVYLSCQKSFECLLGVDSKFSIRDLAVQHGCLEAVNTASKILNRCLKLKVEKSKLLSASGVRRSIFERLCAQLERIGAQICQENTAIAQQPRKKTKTLLERIERDRASDDEDEDVPRKQARRSDADVEDYEEWKRKILENATKAAKPNV
ncbi:hypothetical protein GDO78_003364 [Eleutherodactylus coqui]|uniref:Origin recognition complex subunit 6 n=1 Tax=Eleutherodactylus coqui TaxID=57060 RepID=A0A8J6ET44_ELECQ|nr:hypothetical protein GDO78_003364 [Eleutherodactylus coqui]